MIKRYFLANHRWSGHQGYNYCAKTMMISIINPQGWKDDARIFQRHNREDFK